MHFQNYLYRMGQLLFTCPESFRDYSGNAFLTMFRMHRDAFWNIVKLLTPYWKKTERAYRGGQNIREISMQITVGLYCLVLKEVEFNDIEYLSISLMGAHKSTFGD